MKNICKNLFTLLVFSFLGTSVYAQYGPQIENRGFENWTSRDEQSVSEPVHWHSGGTATGGWAFMLTNQIEQDSHTRPNSSGSKSVRIFPHSTLGVLANGNITNGRMNAGSTSSTGANNYNYTQRSQNAFNSPINQLPDSLSIWVCFRCTSTSEKAQVKAIVHGDADYQIIANGTESPADKHVATAALSFYRTAANGGSYNWRRLSIPFQNTGPCTDVRYILMTATTNETPGHGNSNDDLFIDDLLLIYNPTLTMGQLASNSYTPGSAITIPFTLSGTMSPENLNASANLVIAQLSDANGSFSNPTELGRVTTNNSGNISAQLPNVSGQYTIRVISTNYPMIGQNPQQITISNPTYNIAVSANPSAGGTVAGGGEYTSGQSCTVTATANTGYTFTNWTENGTQVSTQANYTFTVQGNRNLVANFTLNTYTITATANPTNGGTVSGAGTFNHGASCTLTATAATGYTFTNWTENGSVVSSNANYTFTVQGNRNLVANFTLNTYTITATANPTNGGTVSGAGTFNHGASCTLTATAATGYTFTNWTENGSVVSSNANYTFTVEGNRNLVANFTVITYTITVSANPSNSGTTSGGGTYNHGQSCTVIATSADGYTFSNWTENGSVVSSNANYTFTVTSNRSLVANFVEQEPDTYNINVSPNPNIGGTVTGGGTYMGDEQCTVTATANEGYTFVNWTEDGDEVSTEAIYTFIVAGNRNLVANFTLNSYMINVTAEPSEGGTLSGEGTYNHGELCTITATENENYEFINWTKDDVEVSTEPEDTFTVTEAATYVAHFNYFDKVDEAIAISQIFPNPFAATLSIRTNKTVKNVNVFDINGRLVRAQEVSDSVVDIDLSDLNDGSYLLQLDFGDSTSTHRIVKLAK